MSPQRHHRQLRHRRRPGCQRRRAGGTCASNRARRRRGSRRRTCRNGCTSARHVRSASRCGTGGKRRHASHVPRNPAGRRRTPAPAASPAVAPARARRRPRVAAGSPRRLITAGRVFSLLRRMLFVGWSMQTERYITPKRGMGYALGIIGGSLMLLLLLYSLRKRYTLAAFPRTDAELVPLSHGAGNPWTAVHPVPLELHHRRHQQQRGAVCHADRRRQRPDRPLHLRPHPSRALRAQAAAE